MADGIDARYDDDDEADEDDVAPTPFGVVPVVVDSRGGFCSCSCLAPSSSSSSLSSKK